MNKYFSHQPKITLRKLNFIQSNFRLFIFSLTIISLLIYLISINSTATKGIEISQMQQQIDKLSEKNRTLEIEAGELKSLERVEQISSGDLSMVVSKNYKYLPAQVSGEVAVKK